MARASSLWMAMAGQWPVLGVDPLSADRLRKRAEVLRLPVVQLAVVDWISSLFLFVTPFLAHLLLGGGTISAAQLFLLLGLGALLFIALQRPARYLALLALGANPSE
jgi:hypothetical protein